MLSVVREAFPALSWPRGQLLSHLRVLPYEGYKMLRSHRPEEWLGRLERPGIRTENRGFVMKTFTGKGRLSLLLGLAGLLSFVAPQARADEEKDPPTRVARISYVDGFRFAATRRPR